MAEKHLHHKKSPVSPSALFVWIVILAAGVIVFFFFKSLREKQREEQKTVSQACVTKTEVVTVVEDELEPLVKKGQKIKVLHEYYKCNPVQRGDIVMFNQVSAENKPLKVVVGVQTDQIAAQKTNGGWNLLINKEVAKNSQGQPYVIVNKFYPILALYLSDYKGRIPDKAYVVLGNKPQQDFPLGFVSSNDFVGKVIQP